ncbi:Uclacyanin 1, putative [Theobroma cacao]|uniref:Uclacyanin 1, putative n=1 Tax=Theobroma cacao TaxID=3641 RepID=A0A061F1I5_THECC|nr:Uclacyanin 1, putative [Theobroma cacao]
MASNKFLMLTIVAIFLPAIAMATDYIVGDDSGWTINFDYQAWAKDKVFRIGDKLVFQYPQGYHNVFKVNGTAFKNCDIPPADEALNSGNDTIVLKTPGRKWYICGVSDHCSAYSQKLAITVQYSYGPAPAPAPSSPWAPTPESWSPAAPSVPATPTQPWAPAPQPWSPTPSPPAPTAPWPPAPSPYPWI